MRVSALVGSQGPQDEGYRVSSGRRPFRLQLSVSAAAGFGNVPASRGRCQFSEGCRLFEWNTGERFCRDHWLLIYQQDRLPERRVQGVGARGECV